MLFPTLKTSQGCPHWFSSTQPIAVPAIPSRSDPNLRIHSSSPHHLQGVLMERLYLSQIFPLGRPYYCPMTVQQVQKWGHAHRRSSCLPVPKSQMCLDPATRPERHRRNRYPEDFQDCFEAQHHRIQQPLQQQQLDFLRQVAFVPCEV
jgi:hypothetical protein